MSKPKRRWPDLLRRRVPLARQGTTSDLSPSSTPTPENPGPVEVSSTPTASGVLQTTASASTQQVVKVEDRTATGALRTAVGALQASLNGLPSLKLAIDGLVECVSHLQVQEQNRKSFEVLASQLADLANLLQKHVVESKPQNVPYSIEFVVRSISEQTNIIKECQDRSRISRAASALEDQEIVMEGYRRICTLFQQLQADVSLSIWDILQRQQMDTRIERLTPVYDARYNTALPTTIAKRVSCTKNTRVKLLDDAKIWACDGNAAKINWLNGMAGTGKTTIAYTICQMLDADKRLAASFFCSRDSPDCRDVRKIVPTIAYQLGRYSIPYKKALCDVLEEDPDASKNDINTQFERLISKPLAEIGNAMPLDVVVVIDALDECADDAGTKDMLNTLISHAANLPLKFFVASRPEPAISESMAARDGASRSILRLHDIEMSLVQADIAVYLTEALKSIQVTPREIEQLAARAGNLFIFAATAVRYILPDKGSVNRRKRLLEVLTLQADQKSRSHRGVDDLYATILANALDEEIYNEVELTTRRQVLWTAICAKEPLTIPALAEILHIPGEEDIRVAIQPLQSVLHVSESISVVSALHASFPDFLLAKGRSGRFHCDEGSQNSYLADCCFRLMDRSLKFNICGLESSYEFDEDVPGIQNRVDKAISTGLFYSCRYWGDHLTRGPPLPGSLLLLDSFLQQRLLFWMEVLNLKCRIGHGEVVLSQVLAWLPTEDKWAELREFAYDARNFLTSFAGNPTSFSTPHIYVSTLPFTSKESRVRTAYLPRTRGLVEIKGVATEGRGKSALATWPVGSRVYRIAQSNDGKRIVSGSDNGVSVWDASSGTRILGPLEGHECDVRAVAFSPDSTCIASGARDCTIRIWGAYNGDLVVGPLLGHSELVISVAFSPDGIRLASGSSDRTIRIWDAHTGAAIGVYHGHQNSVWCVAFSPDGQHLGSGSADSTIRVWNWRTGVPVMGPMEGHTSCVTSIAYSSDGSRLASGSLDCTVRVWDMSSGTLLVGPFGGHEAGVMSVSFSPDDTRVVSSSPGKIRVWEAESGTLLAGPFQGGGSINAVLFTTDGTRIISGSNNGTICVWDAGRGTTGTTESPGHPDSINCVTISPDGTRAASGSHGTAICVWDTHNGALVASSFNGHTRGLKSVAFSPDGARIISGSWDNTLRTWDASTGAFLIGPFEGHSASVTSVAFSPDGSQVASGSFDHTIRLWDSYTGELVAEPFKDHVNLYVAASIAFSPGGTCIVSGSWSNTVQMWDKNDGTALWASGPHNSPIECVAFSPDGSRVLAGWGSSVWVLDAGHGWVLHGPFTGHTDDVLSVAFSPDGKRVASGSKDKTVRMWDVHSGMEVTGPLKCHTADVPSVAYFPNGAHIISGSYDGTIRFWDLGTDSQIDAASFDGWSIDDDGWLVDSQWHPLFWVPSDLRHGFWFPTPSNPLVSNARSITRVDNATLLGDRWQECYDESLRSFPS